MQIPLLATDFLMILRRPLDRLICNQRRARRVATPVWSHGSLFPIRTNSGSDPESRKGRSGLCPGAGPSGRDQKQRGAGSVESPFSPGDEDQQGEARKRSN